MAGFEDFINPQKSIFRDLARQRAESIELADPARLDEILFGTPRGVQPVFDAGQEGFFGVADALSSSGVDIFGKHLPLEFGGPGSARNRGIEAGRSGVSTPGLFSQFKKGMLPQLTQILDELTRAGGAFQSDVAGSNARRRLTGTGIGLAREGGAARAGGEAQAQTRRQFDFNAFNTALDAAVTLMTAQAGVPSAGGAPSTASAGLNLAASFLIPFFANRGQGGRNTTSTTSTETFGGSNNNFLQGVVPQF